MPIYEYRCSSCGQELEKLQRISEAPLTDCPGCEKPALRRLISPAGFRLKGSGWYETDFKKDRKRNVAGSSSEGDGQGGKKDESKSSGSGEADKSAAADAKKTQSDKGNKASAA